VGLGCRLHKLHDVQNAAWWVEKIEQLASKAPFSKRFEEIVGRACESAAASQVARRFQLPETTVRAIDMPYLERRERRRRKPPLRQMGVDEIGKNDKFLTVVSNLESGEPLWFGNERKKETLGVVVAMSIFLIAALGLAVDGGQVCAQRQMAQAAADAAAEAGIMSIFNGTNSTAANPFGTGSAPIASYVCTTSNLRTPCVYALYNGFGATASDTVTLSYPATVSGVTLAPGTVPAFTVTVQRTLQTGLIRFLPGVPATSSITAKATAGLVGTVSPNCIYVLDPSASSAFQANNGATVTVTGCGVSVNSTSASALSVTGGATLSACAKCLSPDLGALLRVRMRLCGNPTKGRVKGGLWRSKSRPPRFSSEQT
jgi:Flp pilus assembly protein TadG